MTPHISKPLAALLRALGSLLEEQGVEGHVVGGFWRDILAGRAVHDVDVAVAADTLALGRELARRLDASLVVLDSDRGIVRLALRERPVDFVDLTPLRGDILQDLAYRDFTIDAMAAPLTANGVGPFIDPYGG
ncbi:MAG TPA: hypothetical protein VJ256_04540, partial [Dehalococcoidia bacterium]|nr:hypothetical protein [Dehalococcoidia bacterium]